MRLDKYLSECNIGTRSEVKKYIKQGFVLVDGERITDASLHIDENHAKVVFDGSEISYSKYRYYLLNKPTGCVSAVCDNIYPTVMECLDGANIKDCAPVGRLDLDTEGLIIITNDGALSHRLTSPTHHIRKRYFAILDSPCPKEAVGAFETGIDIGDKNKTRPARLEIEEDAHHVYIDIYEGRYHQVKRMFEAVGCNVVYLRRESIGELTLADLKVGEYRTLGEEEIKKSLK